MQGQDAPEAVGKEDQVERPPRSRDSPRSHVRRGPRQSPQEDLHTSTSLSQEKLFLGVWLESKDRWDGGLGSSGSCGKTLREGEIQWLQDQMSGEDKHKEQLCERIKLMVLREEARRRIRVVTSPGLSSQEIIRNRSCGAHSSVWVATDRRQSEERD